MFFNNWVSNSEILNQLLKLGKKMSQTQEKIDALAAQGRKAKAEILEKIAELQAQIDAGEQVDLSELIEVVQGIDDITPDEPETGTDTGPVA